jgi:hypothetical protein
MPSPKLDEADGDARLVEAEYADRRTEQACSDFVRRVKERTVWVKNHTPAAGCVDARRFGSICAVSRLAPELLLPLF